MKRNLKITEQWWFFLSVTKIALPLTLSFLCPHNMVQSEDCPCTSMFHFKISYTFKVLYIFVLLLEYIDLKIFLACRYPKPEIAIVNRAKEVSSAETPDSFGTVQYCSMDCLSYVYCKWKSIYLTGLLACLK